MRATKWIALFLSVLGFSIARGQYDSVVSVNPPGSTSCVAVELDLTGGSALSGLQWFHNDGEQVFPRVVIVEGVAGQPPDLDQPGLILGDIAGVSLDWGALTLTTPVTSSTGTAFAVFFYPGSVPTVALGNGGGPGLGLRQATGPAAPFYLSADAQAWVRFDSQFELGVHPVLSALKGRAASIAELGVPIELASPAPGPEVGIQLITRLAQPVPNPFNPRVTVAFELAAPTRVDLGVYDLRGRRVRTLVDAARTAGMHEAVWEGRDDAGRGVASGVYFARLEAGAVIRTRRMVLVR